MHKCPVDLCFECLGLGVIVITFWVLMQNMTGKFSIGQKTCAERPIFPESIQTYHFILMLFSVCVVTLGAVSATPFRFLQSHQGLKESQVSGSVCTSVRLFQRKVLSIRGQTLLNQIC